jgi:cyclophilin family peptidyl-prolyl cis-trans isomerase
MARRGDPDSASAQFFINVADNLGLDFPNPDGYGYAVFGKVTKGMEVVDAIVGVPTTNAGGHQNVPAEPITLKKASIVE